MVTTQLDLHWKILSAQTSDNVWSSVGQTEESYRNGKYYFQLISLKLACLITSWCFLLIKMSWFTWVSVRIRPVLSWSLSKVLRPMEFDTAKKRMWDLLLSISWVIYYMVVQQFWNQSQPVLSFFMVVRMKENSNSLYYVIRNWMVSHWHPLLLGVRLISLSLHCYFRNNEIKKVGILCIISLDADSTNHANFGNG
jgi:hypothetical protein